MRVISLGLSFGMKNVTIVPIRPEKRLTDICNKYKSISGNSYNYLNSFFSIVNLAKMGDDRKFGDAQKLDCLYYSTVRSINFERKK